MSFTSPEFFVWLAPAVVLFHCLPTRLRTPYLLVLSYAVYWLLSSTWLFLLVAVTLSTYGCARRIVNSDSPGRKRAWVTIAIAVMCAALLLFKLPDPLSRLGVIPRTWQDVALPVGFSFYCLRLIGHLLDVYWNAAAHEPSLVRFAAWTAFFPQIVNGPIQRSHEFLPQLDAAPFSRSDFERLETGCGLILWGLFQKLVIADRLAVFVGDVDVAPVRFSTATLVLASYCCILQIYADFAGFTHVVIGIGRLFGIEGPPNFDAPFSAASIQEFWRRWHMSLTRWLGDYVYTPLRLGPLRRWGRLGIAAALMATMLLIGLWHRLSSGYLAFGVLHGCFMIGSALTESTRARWLGGKPWLARLRHAWGVLVTFHLVAFAQIFARATTLRGGLSMLALMAHGGARQEAPMPTDEWLPLVLCASAAFVIGSGVLEAMIERRRVLVPRWLGYSLALLVLVLLAAEQSGPFLYVDHH